MRNALLDFQGFLTQSPLDSFGETGVAGFIVAIGIMCIIVSGFGLREALASNDRASAMIFINLAFWSVVGAVLVIALAMQLVAFN